MSSFAELTGGSFRDVIGDALDPSRVRKVVFCTGKVYYDLIAAREARKVEDIALVRIEELYPFPEQSIVNVLARYSPKRRPDLVPGRTAQHGRMALHVRLLQGPQSGDPLRRNAARTPARPPVSAKRHAEEQKRLIEDALK